MILISLLLFNICTHWPEEWLAWLKQRKYFNLYLLVISYRLCCHCYCCMSYCVLPLPPFSISVCRSQISCKTVPCINQLQPEFTVYQLYSLLLKRATQSFFPLRYWRAVSVTRCAKMSRGTWMLVSVIFIFQIIILRSRFKECINYTETEFFFCFNFFCILILYDNLRNKFKAT